MAHPGPVRPRLVQVRGEQLGAIADACDGTRVGLSADNGVSHELTRRRAHRLAAGGSSAPVHKEIGAIGDLPWRRYVPLDSAPLATGPPRLGPFATDQLVERPRRNKSSAADVQREQFGCLR